MIQRVLMQRSRKDSGQRVKFRNATFNVLRGIRARAERHYSIFRVLGERFKLNAQYSSINQKGFGVAFAR